MPSLPDSTATSTPFASLDAVYGVLITEPFNSQPGGHAPKPRNPYQELIAAMFSPPGAGFGDVLIGDDQENVPAAYPAWSAADASYRSSTESESLAQLSYVNA